ncbi:hypothetical protein BDF14DRAFT_1854576, partial [Spinellus fusiger]
MYDINHRSALLLSSYWYKAGEILQITNRIRNILYTHRLSSEAVSKLSVLHEQLRKANTGCPFSAHARFPKDADFVCESYDTWPHLLQQLKLALSRLSVPMKKIDPPCDFAYTFKDAEVELWETTSAILSSIGKMEGIFTHTLENLCEVEWKN